MVENFSENFKAAYKDFGAAARHGPDVAGGWSTGTLAELPMYNLQYNLHAKRVPFISVQPNYWARILETILLHPCVLNPRDLDPNAPAGPAPPGHDNELVSTGPFDGTPLDWAIPYLVSTLLSREAASAMTNKQAAQQIIATSEVAISQFLDDYCGAPPRLIPWPFPGPPPWVSIIAVELAETASTVQEGSFRAALLQLAGRFLDRVALNPQPLPP
jgi:hypothetical protein